MAESLLSTNSMMMMMMMKIITIHL